MTMMLMHNIRAFGALCKVTFKRFALARRWAWVFFVRLYLVLAETRWAMDFSYRFVLLRSYWLYLYLHNMHTSTYTPYRFPCAHVHIKSNCYNIDFMIKF